jgi:hypothetical protein
MLTDCGCECVTGCKTQLARHSTSQQRTNEVHGEPIEPAERLETDATNARWRNVGRTSLLQTSTGVLPTNEHDDEQRRMPEARNAGMTTFGISG